MRKLVTNDSVHVSPGLVSWGGGGAEGRPLKLHIHFRGIGKLLLGGSNIENWREGVFLFRTGCCEGTDFW